MIQRGKAHTIAADGQQGMVNVGNGGPLEVLDRIGEILVDGGLTDLRCCFVDCAERNFANLAEFLVEGSHIGNISQSSEAWAVAGDSKVYTGEAIPVSRNDIRRFRGDILGKHKGIFCFGGGLAHRDRLRFCCFGICGASFRGKVSAFSRLLFEGAGITVKSAPSETPAVEFGDRNRRGISNIIIRYGAVNFNMRNQKKGCSLCQAEKK
jgi:hypothetical protein